MKTSWLLIPALSLGLMLGGCAVVPERDYGYAYDRDYVREMVIVTPPPRIEYRAYPPAANFIWIDGYGNRIGRQHDWVSGYWAPPQLHARPPQRYWRGDGGRRMETPRQRERKFAHEREHARENADQRQDVHQREIRRQRLQEDRRSRNESPRRWEGERRPVTVGAQARFRAGLRADNQAREPERPQREPRAQREPRRELGPGDDSRRNTRHQRRFPGAGQE